MTSDTLSVVAACRSMPAAQPQELVRDSAIETIRTVAEGPADVVVVEGNEGTGKTTLLAQFARRYGNRTIALFALPASRWSYHPDTLRLDLLNQLTFAATGQDAVLNALPQEDQQIRKLVFQLRRTNRLPSQPFFFVVDGLFEGGDQSDALGLLEILPLGYPGFKVLLSALPNAGLPQLPNAKTFLMPVLGSEEAQSFLSGLSLSASVADELRRVGQGHPGRLASIRRLLESGVTQDSILRQPSRETSAFFELEWASAKRSPEEERLFLAAVAHATRPHTVQEWAEILNTDEARIRAWVVRHSFMSLNGVGGISFISEAHRLFATQQLNYLKDRAYHCIITQLLKNPSSASALLSLPDYLLQADRLEDLLDFLTPEHLSDILRVSQSFTAVRTTARLGVQTALGLKRNPELLRFSLHASSLAAAALAPAWKADADALISIEDFEGALTLAQAIPSKEDRLHLLAIIARAKKADGLSPEAAVLDQMAALLSEVDPRSLGERAADIAAELLASFPKDAIRFQEAALEASKRRTSDLAYFRLSLQAASQPRVYGHGLDDLSADLLSHIENPVTRRVGEAAGRLLRGYSADVAIAEAERLERTDERLFLLELWLNLNSESPGAIAVADYTLKLVIRSPETFLSADLLTALSGPLSHHGSAAAPQARELLDLIDTQRRALPLEVTADLTRLDMRLAVALADSDLDAARNRLVDIYARALQVEDLAVRTECLAHIIAALSARGGPVVELERKEGVRELAVGQLRTDLSALFSATAYHYTFAHRVIAALSGICNDLALEVATSLNTLDRRSSALRDVIEEALLGDKDSGLWQFIEKVVNQVELPIYAAAAVRRLWRVAGQSPAVWAPTLEGDAAPFRLVDTLLSPEDRLRALGTLWMLFMERGDEGRANQALRRLRSTLTSMPISFARIDGGYWLARSVAAYDRQLARDLISETRRISQTALVRTPEGATAIHAILDLTLRMFAGLFAGKHDNPADLDRVRRLFDVAASDTHRSLLYSELALRFDFWGRGADCSRVVDEYLRPALDLLRQDSPIAYYDALEAAAPSLYKAHPDICIGLVEIIPQPHRDVAYHAICEYLLERIIPREPREGDGKPRATYDDLLSACVVLSQMEQDAAIYGVIARIADCMDSREGRRSLSRPQQAAVAQRLERIVQSKLPSPRYIQHVGYRVIADAQLMRVRKARIDDWRALLGRVGGIPNLSDRAFVRLTLVPLMPSFAGDERRTLAESAVRDITQIPSAYERAKRFVDFGDAAGEAEPSAARRALKSAVEHVRGADEEEYLEQRLIDAAYAIDPKFARSLVEQLEGDEARVQGQRAMKKELEQLQTRDKLRKNEEVLAEIEDEQLGDQAWRALGQLNSGVAQAQNLSRYRDLLARAAGRPLDSAYPVYAWVIENATRRLAESKEAGTDLRQLYEAVVLAAELLVRLSAPDLRNALGGSHDLVPDLGSAESMVAKPGKRADAFAYLAQWQERQDAEYLKVCDPYFSPEDLSALREIVGRRPPREISVLTSRQHAPAAAEDAYRSEFERSGLAALGVSMVICMAGAGAVGELPIHDRWLISRAGGVRIGTSLKSLGGRKLSEISELSSSESAEREAAIDAFVQRRVREHLGERVTYSIIAL